MDRLDKQYGVDVVIATERRNSAWAVRLRGRSYLQRFGDVTIRYESLQTYGKKLEMQKSIARFLFYGWCDTDRPRAPKALLAWHIIYLQPLVDKFLNGRIAFSGPHRNKDQSSTFVSFSVDTLKSEQLLVDTEMRQSVVTPQCQGAACDLFVTECPRKSLFTIPFRKRADGQLLLPFDAAL